MSGGRTVWVLTDGVPGHEAQSKGLIRVLGQLGKWDVHWVPVSLRAGGLRTPLKWLLNAGMAVPDKMLKSVYRVGAWPAAKPDLIISSGGKTLFASAALARRHDCPNLFMGTLRGLDAALFSAVLAPLPLPDAQAITLDVPLNAIDIAALDHKGAALRSRLGLDGVPLLAVLIGGDGGGYSFTPADWAQVGDVVAGLAETHAMRLVVSTSRRTGAQAEDILKARLEGPALADAVWYTKAPRPVVADYLGAADAIIITEDSITMLSEALSTGKPVLSLRPQPQGDDLKVRTILNHIGDRARIQRVLLGEPVMFDIRQGSGMDQARQDEKLAAHLAPIIGRAGQ